MTNFQAIILLITGGVILSVLTMIFKHEVTGLLGMVVWFAVSAYCIYQVNNAGDPNSGIWVWVFAIVAFMAAIATVLMPNMMRPKEKPPAPRSNIDIFVEGHKGYQDGVNKIKSLRPKRKSEYPF